MSRNFVTDVESFILKNNKVLFLKRKKNLILVLSKYAKRVPTDGTLLSQFSVKVSSFTYNEWS